jgi:uncharacterized damage-inducible protein DinB
MRLHSLFQGAHAFISIPAALAGLSDAAATAKPASSAHSIAEIVAHMRFWQRWFLDRCDGVAIPVPVPASLGWPTVSAGEWEPIRVAFEADFGRALALTEDEARVANVVTPAIEFGPLGEYTVRDALTHIALHNAHHLGQVITLRQQVATWPPPAGSWTW